MPKGSRVVMADDDKMLIDMYKERLELAGYIVTICRNGEEALAKVREVKPDIVLLDIMMPKLNGYEALASIKSDPAVKDIPVIMLSALMRDFNREKAVEAGADDYLIKSEAMPADVITKIEQVLMKYGKGSSPVPGQVAPNIQAPSATPPVVSMPPASEPTPVPIMPTPSLAASASPKSASPAQPIVAPLPASPLVTKPVATPHASVMQPDAQITHNETDPDKIIFEPASTQPSSTSLNNLALEKPVELSSISKMPITPEKKNDMIETGPPKIEMAAEKKEEVPIVKLNPVLTETSDTPEKSVAKSQEPWESSAEKGKKEKSPASIALIVIVAILLTALINDVVIYFFFLQK